MFVDITLIKFAKIILTIFLTNDFFYLIWVFHSMASCDENTWIINSTSSLWFVLVLYISWNWFIWIMWFCCLSSKYLIVFFLKKDVEVYVIGSPWYLFCQSVLFSTSNTFSWDLRDFLEYTIIYQYIPSYFSYWCEGVYFVTFGRCSRKNLVIKNHNKVLVEEQHFY